ncbi:DNA helicase MCM8 isoform X2 [Orussus abietinus]|uniref:DNA helicase MCM8 isoform X2 n=1 Tax=Orussus abietinus TaxID=222816 RepID=UPI000626604A|nr:DNA helicase MCM8 isoform X2 [Orussus abietinus]
MNSYGKRNYFKGKKRKRNSVLEPKKNTKNCNNSPSGSDPNKNLWNLDGESRKPAERYYGWSMYFYDEGYKENSLTVKKVQAYENFLRRNYDFSSIVNFNADVYHNVDVTVLYSDNTFLTKWPTFKMDIKDTPDHTLNCLGLAIHQAITNFVLTKRNKCYNDVINDLSMIKAKILNFEPITPLRNLKVNSCGKLITTTGCVIRVSYSKHLSQWIMFACSRCKWEKREKQTRGIYTIPNKCDTCGTVKFNPMLDSSKSATIPSQMIKLQEYSGDEQDDRGKVPRILDVELLGDLVNTCLPGDYVTITGIVKAEGNSEPLRKKNTTNSFSLYMEAISIVTNKNETQCKSIMGIEFDDKDYIEIKIHDQQNLFETLVHSLCPGIYGHEIIKTGLILSLFGGSTKQADLREEIHILLVGDPGLGKSQMLQACSHVAPKGVYISGNSSTSSGLTVTLVKEPGSSDFALEPGALVLADRGCCCIDEFDKMSTQYQALLEAMEQQCVSVAKSGTLCSLPARTSILSAANPIGGRYDSSKTVIQNLKMNQPLLTRFDLVFLLLDQPNENRDNLLCKHVMTLHTGQNKLNQEQFHSSSKGAEETFSQGLTFREKLILSKGNVQCMSHAILRKYISYARQYVKPKLTTASAAVLERFYIELRKQNTNGNIQVFNRQLEALIRLTEARAKSELRTVATETDAQEVIEIVKFALASMSSELGPTSSNIHNSSNSGKLTGNKVKHFIRLLKEEAQEQDKSTFSTRELRDVARKGSIVINDFTEFLLKLNDQGFLLKKGLNLYAVVLD